ncbi:unnamed protein product [Paramecium pentaurelia]|uniref:Uncharacterized protein n=1 Tax=Paramecium pentaurelia TaxID=43138 RepID=A0A8S1WWJ9_9CILI|nr:unnamed protein product [Paramecium pentaurelia]
MINGSLIYSHYKVEWKSKIYCYIVFNIIGLLLRKYYSRNELYQQELIFQAGALLFEYHPCIEQILAIVETIDDGTNEQMLLLLSEAENEISHYAEFQSLLSDIKVFEENQKIIIEQTLTDKPQQLAQTTVFIAFLLLLNSKDQKRLLNQRICQGLTLTTEKYLINQLTGIKVENTIRFYRKVEYLVINNNGDRK